MSSRKSKLSRVANAPRGVKASGVQSTPKIKSVSKTNTAVPKKTVIRISPTGTAPHVGAGLPIGMEIVTHRPAMSFMPCPPGHKRVRFRIPFCNLIKPGSVNSANFGMNLYSSQAGGSYAQHFATSVAWNPVRSLSAAQGVVSGFNTYDALADSNFLALEGISCSRYSLHELGFEYEGVGSTTSDQYFRFAYSEDPSHPTIGFQAYALAQAGLGTFPTITQLAIGENTVTFAPYQSWRMTVPVDPGTTYYTYQQIFGSSGSAVPTPVVVRSASPGVFSVCCSDNGGGGSTGLNVGELYVFGDIEFRDMTPLSDFNVVPALIRCKEGKAALPVDGGSELVERKEKPKVHLEDDDYVSTTPHTILRIEERATAAAPGLKLVTPTVRAR